MPFAPISLAGLVKPLVLAAFFVYSKPRKVFAAYHPDLERAEKSSTRVASIVPPGVHKAAASSIENNLPLGFRPIDTARVLRF